MALPLILAQNYGNRGGHKKGTKKGPKQSTTKKR